MGTLQTQSISFLTGTMANKGFSFLVDAIDDNQVVCKVGIIPKNVK